MHNKIDSVERHIQEAALIKEMCGTPGFKLINNRFEEKVKKATSRLLDMSTSDDEIKQIRLQLSVWTEITKMLKGWMMTGEYASRMLNDLEVNSLASGEQGEQ